MNPRLEQLNPIPILVAILGCGFALYLGTVSGAGQYFDLTSIFLGIGLLAYLIHFYRFTWQISIFLTFIGLAYAPFGFRFNAIHLVLLLFTSLFLATVWRKQQITAPAFCQTNAFKFLMFMYALCACYVILHAIFNTLSPYSPEDFSYKSMLKSYFSRILTPLYIVFACYRLGLFKARTNFTNIIGVCLFIGLVFNIVIRLIFIPINPEDNAGGDDQLSFLYIPVINVMTSRYVLRGLAPFAALVGFVFSTREYYRLTPHPGWTRFMFRSMMVLGFVGAALSGGRGSIVAAFGLIVVACFVLKRYARLMLCMSSAIAAFLILNLLGPSLQSLPLIYQRTLQWVLLEKNPAVVGTIAGSSEWRNALFYRAIEEWRSSSRIFWFGRSTYSYSEADLRGAVSRNQEDILQSSLRRGATHNSLSDDLLFFGLVGWSINLIKDLAFLYASWILYRMTKRSNVPVNLLAGVCIVTSGSSIVGGFFASGVIYDPSWLLFIIMLSRLATEKQDEKEAEKKKLESSSPSRLPLFALGHAK